MQFTIAGCVITHLLPHTQRRIGSPDLPQEIDFDPYADDLCVVAYYQDGRKELYSSLGLCLFTLGFLRWADLASDVIRKTLMQQAIAEQPHEWECEDD